MAWSSLANGSVPQRDGSSIALHQSGNTAKKQNMRDIA